MYIKTKIFLLFFLILPFVFNVKDVCGFSYFSDNFDQNNLDNWILIPGPRNTGQGSWEIIDNKLVGQINANESAFLLAKSFWDLSDYSIRLDSINEGGVDQEIVFRISEDRSKYYLLNLRFNDVYWPQDGGEIVLLKYNIAGWYQTLATFNSLNQINLTQYDVHKIKIELIGANIKIYFDSKLIIDFYDENNPNLNGSFGFYNWGGNYFERPTKNLFDNLIVGDFNYDDVFDPVLTPTSVPVLTPTLVPKKKIIILPGFGASWNSEAIVYNKTIGNDEWIMTPFVKNYDGLINALEQNNLVKNQDYFIWNYDWRKPLREIVDDLNGFIDRKINPGEKVILIGHSLGGLTARIWAEDNKNDSRLDRVITLGSPHLGSVDAYEAWNGGQISDLTKFSSIAFKTLLKLQTLSTNTEMDAVRKYTPLVKDLLPTFDFVRKDGILLSNNKLRWKNDYLSSKNSIATGLNDSLKLFVGNGYKTSSGVVLKDNTYFDKILGLWPDGRINNFIYTDVGDGTVLVKSANYGKDNFVEIKSNHGDIIDGSINQMMAEIGLSQVSFATETKNFKNNLVFFVGSPVNYFVDCDGNRFNESGGFVVIENKSYKLCKINLVGTDDGLVHIVAGNTNNDDWFYLEKNINLNETLDISINPKNGRMINNKENINLLKLLIKKDLNKLISLYSKDKNLKETVKFFDKNQPKQIIKNIFQFRLNNNEDVISRKIINNVKIWMSISEKCSFDGLYSGCATRLINVGFAREKFRFSRLNDNEWWLLGDSDL